MWIFTSFGAFMPALRPPETVPDGDVAVLQIRARRQVDLTRLRRHYMPELERTYRIPGSDYQYRAHCTRADLASAMVRITLDIDYVKFKPTTVDVWRDHDLHDVYLNVWQVVYDRLGRRRRPPVAFDPWESDPASWEDRP